VPSQQTGYAEQVLAHSECMIGADWQRIAANPAFANCFFRCIMVGHVIVLTEGRKEGRQIQFLFL
jgi:hypothetical protein